MPYAFDGPYRDAQIRPCVVTQKAPTYYAPNGVYVSWTDLSLDTPSWVSRGGWKPAVYDDVAAAERARTRVWCRDKVDEVL